MTETHSHGEYLAYLEHDGKDGEVKVTITLAGSLTPLASYVAENMEEARTVLPAYVDVNARIRPDNWVDQVSESTNAGDIDSARELLAYMNSRRILNLVSTPDTPLDTLDYYLAGGMFAIATEILRLKVELIEQGIIPGNGAVLERINGIESSASMISDAFDFIAQLREEEEDGPPVLN